LRKKLNGLNAPLELRDETGRTVGVFLPSAEYEQLKRLSEECQHFFNPATGAFFDEELLRVDEESESYSTEEVLRHLEQLRPGDGEEPV
jgi:hypothetical protein